MKCDELEEMVLEDGIGQMWKCYDADEVDEAIAELKDKIQQKDFFWEGCGFAKMGLKNTIDVAEYVDKLKQKIEDVQATAYAEMVDAGMRERRLRRALWLARAKSAENAVTSWCRECMERWNSAERKCLKKAEEYK